MTRRIFVFLIFASLCSAAYAEPPTLTLAYEEKADPPYSMGEGLTVPAENPGINIEVLKGMEKKSNIRIEFSRANWRRCMKMLESNEANGIFQASFTPERMKIGVFPMKDGEPDPARRLMSNSYYLYKLKNSPVGWDGKKFENLTRAIGATMSYSIVADLKEMGVKIEEVYGPLDNLRMLVGGRIDGCAEQDSKTDMVLKKHPEMFRDVVKVSPPIRTKHYYVMFSHQFAKEHPDIVEAIWNELRRLRESGEYDKIVAKYAR